MHHLVRHSSRLAWFVTLLPTNCQSNNKAVAHKRALAKFTTLYCHTQPHYYTTTRLYYVTVLLYILHYYAYDTTLAFSYY